MSNGPFSQAGQLRFRLRGPGRGDTSDSSQGLRGSAGNRRAPRLSPGAVVWNLCVLSYDAMGEGAPGVGSWQSRSTCCMNMNLLAQQSAKLMGFPTRLDVCEAQAHWWGGGCVHPSMHPWTTGMEPAASSPEGEGESGHC